MIFTLEITYVLDFPQQSTRRQIGEIIYGVGVAIRAAFPRGQHNAVVFVRRDGLFVDDVAGRPISRGGFC